VTVTRRNEQPLLEVRDLGFAYGERRVLSGVDLSLQRGELVALLGTNGSGKTTLLRVMAGTLRPDCGTVLFEGRGVGEWRRQELARRVAVLPQRLDLPDGFRVAEVVEMGRAPHARRLFGATADDERAVERALLDADAVDLAHRPVEELSGGERQRVLVAMALAQEPELLLLDEPTVHLDVAHRVRLLSTIARLQHARDLTVLAVLHDLDLAAAFAPRVAVLSDGRVVADGAPHEVVTPQMARTVFGVTMEQAVTADGHPHLVPRLHA
jgi:iron complex transport system ATP-binding protein